MLRISFSNLRLRNDVWNLVKCTAVRDLTKANEGILSQKRVLPQIYKLTVHYSAILYLSQDLTELDILYMKSRPPSEGSIVQFLKYSPGVYLDILDVIFNFILFFACWRLLFITHPYIKLNMFAVHWGAVTFEHEFCVYARAINACKCVSLPIFE